MTCYGNIAEEADSSLHEWLNIYKNWGAAVVTEAWQCVAKKLWTDVVSSAYLAIMVI